MRLLSGLVPTLLASTVTALWPLPKSYSHGSSVLYIDRSVQFTYSVGNQVQANQPSIVSTAISCGLDTILNFSFYPWKFNPRNTNFDPPASAGNTKITKINLVQNQATTTNSSLAVDESYSLSVTTAGVVTVTANTPVGLSYGLTTFTQLFFKTRDNRAYTNLAPVQITDAPLYQHRGLNLDVARSYYPPQSILKQIDGLAQTKMNRLHIHMTDSQSWPLEVPALPLLSEKGAYGPGMTYSPQTLAYIQQYGADRGVNVYIEIDMPGHAGIMELAYPGSTVAWNIQPDWSEWALEPPSGALLLNSSFTDNILEKLFNDVVPRVHKYTNLWHAGGDEVVTQQYLLEKNINSNISSVIKPFMQQFVSRNLDQIMQLGQTPIVWQELLLSWNLTLPAETIVQIWKSSSDVLSAVQLGHRVITGDYNNWYLDCGYGQWLDFYPSDAAEYFPFDDYCSPLKNWRQIYAYDPIEGIPADLQHLVLGGEVSSWSEQTDPVNVDGKVWPRAAAAGEVLWSGPKDPVTGQNRSQVTASPRLSDFRERLVARGIQAEPIQMPFCTQNGTQCAL